MGKAKKSGVMEMNALQLVDKLLEIEHKMTHLKMVMDHVNSELNYRESNEVLAKIMKDYQTQYERTKDMLSHTEVNLRG